MSETGFNVKDTTSVHRATEVWFNPEFLKILEHYRFVIPLGIVDGVNNVFALPLPMDAAKMEVIVNGISINPAFWSVLNGTVFTLVQPVLYPGDMIWIYYWSDFLG